MTLGRLEPVDLRDVWKHEATGFTPWLAKEENIKLLSDTIGMELEVQATEQGVGPFSADILCKSAGVSDHWVLIENQIERTDHAHLGQLLTYAAGLHTATIIWIARRFTDEHRAALDWLNEITKEEISFFGLEVELWRIGDSPAAPKFNVVSRPNNFVKAATQNAASSANASLYLDYWTTFKDLLERRHLPVKALKPQGEYWLDLSTLAPGIRLRAMAGARDKYNMVDLVISNDPDKSKIGYLMQHRAEIDAKIPGLLWRPKDGYKESAVELRKNGSDPNNRQDWPNQHAWLIESIVKMNEAFAPIVNQIPQGNGLATAPL